MNYIKTCSRKHLFTISGRISFIIRHRGKESIDDLMSHSVLLRIQWHADNILKM